MPLTRAMAAAQAEVSETVEDPKPATHHSTSPRKRARTNNNANQHTGLRNATNLKRILDLPIEIFNEIALHLTPSDLLFLARSNKFFRGMFMSRSSINIWRSAFGNVSGLPPCPPDLCEPQYTSLLFSKTCSECGARVLRRMDASLHVRLCNSCREEMVEEFEVEFELLHFLPTSINILPPKIGYIFALKRDWQELVEISKSRKFGNDEEFGAWQLARWLDLKARDQHAAEIDKYLDRIDAEREAELLSLKRQRLEGVKARLLEEGWTNEDTHFRDETISAWNELVFQPKPLTDRIWKNLYPKLVPLLKANKTFHEEEDRKSRRLEREDLLDDMMFDLKQALPPLVEVTVNAQPLDESVASTSAVAENWIEDGIVELDRPFPSTAEVLSWLLVQDLLEPDVSAEEMEPEMEARREAIERKITEWQETAHQSIVDIVQKGRDGAMDWANQEPESLTADNKPVTRAATRRSARLNAGPPPDDANSQLDPQTSPAPNCTVVFVTSDSTTTTDIKDLPKDMQILLRADTIFRAPYSSFYPCLFPTTVSSGADTSDDKRWNAKDVTWDSDASAVAKVLLRRLGRPDATYAEMKALGTNFSCQRCSEGLPNNWEDIVCALYAHFYTLVDL
ncbi:hypothetical protein BDV93DRAFT_372572 [Ceratobasidium sp. AG-I]|nr:hypothetical protein BDV93DRAFT_372572 [Ceratobasidium sp. AG-I]